MASIEMMEGYGNGSGRRKGRGRAKRGMQNSSSALLENEKEVFISWIRGEFAAANAIIDALCNHLRIVGEPRQYEFVVGCILQRRCNWLPLLHSQHYYSIADIVYSLNQVACSKISINNNGVATQSESSEELCSDKSEDSITQLSNSNHVEKSNGCPKEDMCADSPIVMEKEDGQRLAMTKTITNFVANEIVDGQLVNIVKGLKLYENIFNSSELLDLTGYIDELQIAGQQGKLEGETFVAFKRPMKGNGREMLQFGAPIVHSKGQITKGTPKGKEPGKEGDRERDLVEPVPPVLQEVVDRLHQRNLIAGNRRPNCCIINFFNEGDYSQPHIPPLHFERPFYTLSLVSECTLVFGQVITMDHPGDYGGSLKLSLNAGSMLNMQGYSVDIARHAICSSPKRRVTITFAEVQPKKAHDFQSLLCGLQHPPSLSVIPLPVAHRSNGNTQGNSHSLGRITNSVVLKHYNTVPPLGALKLPLMPHLVAAQGIQPQLAYPPLALLASRWPRHKSGTGVFLPYEESAADPRCPLSLSQQQQGLVLHSQSDLSSVTDIVYARPPRSSYSTSRSSKAITENQVSLNNLDRSMKHSCFHSSSKYPISSTASTVTSKVTTKDAEDTSSHTPKVESKMNGTIKDDDGSYQTQ